MKPKLKVKGKPEGETTKLTQDDDRITYHMGRRISDDNYGNVSLGITFTSSVRSNETIDLTTDRVIKYVESTLADRIVAHVDE